MQYIILFFTIFFPVLLSGQVSGMNLELLRKSDGEGYIIYTDTAGYQRYHLLDSLHTALGYKNPDSLGGQVAAYYLDFENLTNLSAWLYNDTIADNELQIFSVTDYVVTGDTIGAIVENSQNGSQFIIADGNGAKARKNGNKIEISLDSAVVDISVNNPTITFSGAQGVNITNGSFTLNQPNNQNITISLDQGTIYTADETTIKKTGNQFSLIDASSQGSVNNSGTDFIQDITLDSYGRVTGLTTANVEALIGASLWEQDNQTIRTLEDNTVRLYMGDFIIGSYQANPGLGPFYTNTFIGYRAGANNQTGDYNFIAGYEAGRDLTGGNGNSFIGWQSGRETTIGNNNFFLGYVSGANNTTGSRNIFIGSSAGQENTTGTENIVIGNAAKVNDTIGVNNTYIGNWSGSLSYGSNNTFFGDSTGVYNNANYNAFFGHAAGVANTTGTYNFFNGYQSGYGNTTGGNNMFMGYRSGYGNTTGGNNMFLGYESGYNNGTGSNNIFIGYRSAKNLVNQSNKLYIENSDSGTPLIYGDFATDDVTINGTIKATNGIKDKNNLTGTFEEILRSTGTAVEWVPNTPAWVNITGKPNGLDDGDDNNYPTILSFGLNTLQLGRSGLGALSVSLADISPDWTNITNIPAEIADGDDYYNDWNITGDIGGITNVTENYTVDFEGTGGITTIWDQSTGRMFIDGQNVAHDWNNITSVPDGLDDGDQTTNICYLDVTGGADPTVSIGTDCDEFHISIHGGGSQLFLPQPTSAYRGVKVYVTFSRSGSPSYDYDLTTVAGGSYIAYKSTTGSVRITDASPTIAVCTKYPFGSTTYFWQIIKSN